MFNKEFDLNKFKAQSSKMSDFLKGKGHDIPKSTLLHGLSVMMGEKNWNTLEAKLKPKKDINKALLYEENLNDDSFIFLNTKFKKSDAIKSIQLLFSQPQNFQYFDTEHLDKYCIINDCNHIIIDPYSVNLNPEEKIDFKDPVLLSKTLQVKNMFNYSSYNLYNLYYDNFIHFINKRIIDRELIGDEIFFKFSMNFNFTDSISSNVSKILYMLLLQYAFSPDHSNNFVHEPLIKINSRGKTVKLSIYSFINPDFRRNDLEFNKLPYFLNSEIYKKETQHYHNIFIGDDKNILPEIEISCLNEREVCFDMYRKN